MSLEFLSDHNSAVAYVMGEDFLVCALWTESAEMGLGSKHLPFTASPKRLKVFFVFVFFFWTVCVKLLNESKMKCSNFKISFI